jgi:hypothetical protein
LSQSSASLFPAKHFTGMLIGVLTMEHLLPTPPMNSK